MFVHSGRLSPFDDPRHTTVTLTALFAEWISAPLEGPRYSKATTVRASEKATTAVQIDVPFPHFEKSQMGKGAYLCGSRQLDSFTSTSVGQAL